MSRVWTRKFDSTCPEPAEGRLVMDQKAQFTLVNEHF